MSIVVITQLLKMPTKSFQCPVCSTNVTKTQQKIGCGICHKYFHPLCAGVSTNMFAVLEKTRAAFTCKSCTNTSVPQNGNGDILKRMEELQKCIENKLDSNRTDIEARMNSGFSNLETKVDCLFDNFRREISGEISKVQSDVAHCYSVVKEVDKATTAKVNALMAKNNVLERRLNRSDILINGLPNKMDNIRDYVIKIGQLVSVPVTMSDINHCCYIRSRKCILVKFNSVHLRDTIMKNYFKSVPLLLKDIVGEELVGGSAVSGGDDNGAIDVVDARVYLKDNLCPASSKLQYLCRKLVTKKKIRKFYLLNMDIPKAKVFKYDGSVVYLDIQQCADMLDGCSGDDDVNGGQRNKD